MRCLRANWMPLVAIVTALGASPAVQACAVCFGKTDSPLGKGLHWGVLALLAFIFTVLVAFGAFAVFLARRSVAVETEREFEENRASAGTVGGDEAATS